MTTMIDFIKVSNVDHPSINLVQSSSFYPNGKDTKSPHENRFKTCKRILNLQSKLPLRKELLQSQDQLIKDLSRPSTNQSCPNSHFIQMERIPNLP